MDARGRHRREERALKNRHYYAQHVGDLKQRLKTSLDVADLRELHRISPVRHFAVVARLVALTLGCGWLLWQTRWPWLWVPAALLQGFNVLGYVILLHEQVHECIFRREHPRLHRLLGWLYAFPAAMSATQFRIWHLDHHNELGSTDDDPKRAHLTPKINRRWYKLLYCTPVLFVIYARAAAREAQGYDAADRRTIARERAVVLLGHVALIVWLGAVGGAWAVARVWVAPLFLAFPIAFVLNRLGQHYNVDRANPAAWSTRVDGNPLWHFLFLWSNFHIEHHYYPRVPFYNLRRLNLRLHPFFAENGIKNRTYAEIVWGWFALNRAPHTDWDRSAASEPATTDAAARS